MADPTHPDKPSTEVTRRRLITWLWRLPVIGAAAAAGWGGYEIYQHQFGRGAPAHDPTFEAKGPIRIGGLSDFGEDYDALEFILEAHPGIALRLPEPLPGGLSTNGMHLVAFSRVCTHLGCIANINRDLEAVAFAFNYRTTSPVLTCHCHLSVFAPDRAGRAVSGPAIEPLPRIALEVAGEELYAVGIEAS